MMTINEQGTALHVTRGDSPKVRNQPNDSAFWFMLKNAMNERGGDFVKRCPGKDGHMYGDTYYLRDRKWLFAWFDPDYAIRSISEAYNSGETVTLFRHRMGEYVRLIFRTRNVSDDTTGVGSIDVNAAYAARIAQEIERDGQAAIDRLSYDSVGHGPILGARYPLGHVAARGVVVKQERLFDYDHYRAEH